MARIRTIKPEFFSHELLASKSAHARLLAIGLLTMADCEGRLRWVPMQVHAQVFPWEASVKIQVLLGELIDCGYVVHYEVEGKQYLEIVNFKKHQRLSGKELGYESRLPGPPKEVEKTNKNKGETGEATGKHPDTSQGSSGNPLGTGEQGNIGTEEQREKKSVSVKPDGVDLQHWNDWLTARKKKHGAGPPTKTAMARIESEAAKAGISVGEAIRIAAEKEWRGFEADWLVGRDVQTTKPKVEKAEGAFF